MRADLWLSKNKRRVHIRDRVSRRLNPVQSLAQENGGVSAFPLRVGWRKQGTNIGRGDGAEKRVGDRMQKYIAIGMATQPFGMSQRDSADLRGIPGLNSCESQPKPILIAGCSFVFFGIKSQFGSHELDFK